MKEQVPAVPAATLDDVLITDQLQKRALRDRDLGAEDYALRLLGDELNSGTTAENLLRRLVDSAMSLCDAGTAGLSVPTRDPEGSQIFRWDALSGALASYVGGTTPRDWSPCGTTLDRGAAQLFYYPGRFFTYFQPVVPAIVEGLVIPVYLDRTPVATIWIVSHDDERKFDLYDVRTMTSLATFTGSALRMLAANTSAT